MTRQTDEMIFEASEDSANTSRWVGLFQHHVTASGAPGKRRLPGWELANITDVVTLQREDEMKAGLKELIRERGWRWHHFPLSGKRMEGATDHERVLALIAWTKTLREEGEPRKIVVHCSAGLHRTGIALYVMWRASGASGEEAISNVSLAREMTGEELLKQPRRGARIVDTAEDLFMTSLSEHHE